jgi:hypothetical protein
MRQIEEDRGEEATVYLPVSGGEGGIGEGGGEAEGEGPNGGGITAPPISPEPVEDLSTSFRGVIDIDPARLGGTAGAISQEVVQRLASIMGSNVRVTLEILADVPEGIPEKVERDVSENGNTLKFREYGFRE